MVVIAPAMLPVAQSDQRSGQPVKLKSESMVSLPGLETIGLGRQVIMNIFCYAQ